jgi:O-antigen/teichoic acid export membrane protein
MKLGYLGWVIMWPCGAIVSYIFYFYILYKEYKIYPNFFSKLNFKKASFKKGLPLIPHQLSLMILSSSDRLLLQYNGVPSRSIGLYSQGYTIGAYGSYFINGFFQAFAKKLQEAFRGVDLVENRIFLRKTIFISCFSISLLLFIGSLFTKEFFSVFFQKDELKNGYTISYLVLCSYMFWPLYSYFTYPLLIFNKTKEVFYISGLAAVINIAGNLILIPHFGIFSALYMTYFSMIVFGLVGLLNQSNRVFFSKILNIGNFILLITLLNISLAFLSFLFLNFTIGFKIAIVLVVITIFYFVIKKINS